MNYMRYMRVCLYVCIRVQEFVVVENECVRAVCSNMNACATVIYECDAIGHKCVSAYERNIAYVYNYVRMLQSDMCVLCDWIFWICNCIRPLKTAPSCFKRIVRIAYTND